MKRSCLLLFLSATAAYAEPGPDFLRDPSRHELRARWNGREASATKDGPSITSTSLAAGSNTVSVLEPARAGKVWVLHTDPRLTIALWVDHDALAPVARKETFLPARADRGDAGAWLKVGCPLGIDGRGRLAVIDDGIVEASLLARDLESDTLYRPPAPEGDAPADRVTVAADTALLDAPAGFRFGRFRKDAVVRRLRQSRGHVLVAHATDDARVVGWIPATSVRPEADVRREPASMEGNLAFATRAIPAGTLVHDGPDGAPIGVAHDWIPAVVEQSHDGWSEVTLGADLSPRVWVRDEQISHLR